MLEALLIAAIYVIVIVVFAAVTLWAVQRFVPEVYPPARLVVGAVALIAVLWVLLRLVRAGLPGLP